MLTPDRKVRMHRAPLWKLLGQHAPLATASEQIQHCTEHLVQIHPARRSLPARALQQRLDGLKLFATDVARIVLSHSPSFSHLQGDFEQVLRGASRGLYDYSCRLVSPHSDPNIYGIFTLPAPVCAHFLQRHLENQTHVLMQELSMDVVWIAAFAAIWIVIVEAVVLLGKFGPARGERACLG